MKEFVVRVNRLMKAAIVGVTAAGAAYAITLGFYEGELLRRIDPKHRSLGQFFQEEIATPLRLAFYIRLPESIPDSELAPLVDPRRSAMLFGFPLRLTLDILHPRSNFRRALLGSEFAHDEQHIYARNRKFPFGSPSSFGHAGGGGSFGFADPEAQIGYAYIPNLKGVTMGGDPRDVALRRALCSAMPVARNQ